MTKVNFQENRLKSRNTDAHNNIPTSTYLHKYVVKLFFVAISKVFTINFLNQIYFQSKELLLDTLCVKIHRLKLFKKTRERLTKSFSAGNSYNKSSPFRTFSRFSNTFKCISEAHFLAYLEARGLI